MPKLEITEENTKIYDSYKLSNEEIKNIVVTIIYKRLKKYLSVTRTQRSYEREIKAHRRLYKLHYKVEHTKDTDLEEPIKWYRELIYFIIGW